MTARRWPGRDRGSFTAELAAGLPALILLLVAGLTAVSAADAKGRCLDAARDGALAAARGEPGRPAAARLAPDGADIEIADDQETVRVRIRARVRLPGSHLSVLTVEGSAVAAREPDPTVGAP